MCLVKQHPKHDTRQNTKSKILDIQGIRRCKVIVGPRRENTLKNLSIVTFLLCSLIKEGNFNGIFVPIQCYVRRCGVQGVERELLIRTIVVGLLLLLCSDRHG